MEAYRGTDCITFYLLSLRHIIYLGGERTNEHQNVEKGHKLQENLLLYSGVTRVHLLRALTLGAPRVHRSLNYS